MKKILSLAVIAAATLFASCNNGSPKASMKNDVDTLSYEIGLSQTAGIENYFQQSGIDSAYIDDFLRGVKDGALAGDDKKKQAYYAGVQAGVQMKTQMFPGIERMIFGNDSTKKLSLRNYLAGFTAGVRHKSALKINGVIIDPEQAGEDANKRFQTLRSKAMEEQYGPQRKTAQDFILKMAKQPGVKKLADGVYYKVIKEGTGAVPSDTSVVRVQYEGKLPNGQVFDSTARNNGGKAVPMKVGQSIPGFKAALSHMPVGSIWEIYIAYDQAYGEAGGGPVPPFSPLIFKVQLEGIGQ